MKKNQVVYTLAYLIAMWVLIWLNIRLIEGGSRFWPAAGILLYVVFFMGFVKGCKEWKTYVSVIKILFVFECFWLFVGLIWLIFTLITTW